MAVAKAEQEFITYLIDLMQSLGPVSAKRMFGGHGIFLDGLMFALVVDRTLYLKVDDVTRNEFVALGLEPFCYAKKDKQVQLSYYQAPEDSLEAIELMNRWGNLAYGAALRMAKKKRK